MKGLIVVIMQDFRPLFMDVDRADTIIESHRKSTKYTEDRAEHSRAVIQVLERQVVNITCDDPGLKLTSDVILPVLRERIESAAREAAEKKAAEAQRDLRIIEVSNLTSCLQHRQNPVSNIHLMAESKPMLH